MTETPISNLEIYGFCDPAGSHRGKDRMKKVRARQAIIIAGVDYLMRVFVLYAWAGRLVASALRDKVIEVYDRWQPRRLGIEANAMQELFGDLVRDEAKKTLAGRIRIFGVPSPTKIEKNFKIRTAIEPLLADGRLFVPESMIELRAEIQGFPTWHLKDLVDCLAMCLMLIPRRPQKQQQDGEREALISYLRNTGAPSAMIDNYAATGRLNADYGRPDIVEDASAWQELLRIGANDEARNRSVDAPERRYTDGN